MKDFTWFLFTLYSPIYSGNRSIHLPASRFLIFQVLALGLIAELMESLLHRTLYNLAREPQDL